ncbi:nuclear receptor coactivator 6 [Tribolium castaneum]|uniref:DUF4211 domain-containing protein n=1 Tax=Tribolium castaneum TaxID=7070 RepID=D2A1W7_TRICA|nr:PREDICTED: nuclear receptor coactivator 6 [Tribolium castaneum]EFA02073.1 hypothetical protein TcasGA2_TC007708 [Tribolium castaneum]|eukprot:XP_972872.1 PREDICTED: nuclear receptor coactivator 6 [Tribolium castaneum]
MDPVGPWSAYASYNRLAGVQGDHHPTGAPPTTTAQLLPGSFLSPTPVGYETVFSPLFHHAGTKPTAHYVAQHRTKQSDSDYHQQPFFEQGAGWQQNSPFGILPHESVVPTTKASTYENFNAHFAAAQSLNHLNSQLAAAKSRAQSPATTKPPPAFFQTATTSNSCIVSTPSNSTVSKEYRVPQTPRTYLTSPNPQRPTLKQPQIQTKAQTKIYPELNQQNERQRNNEEPQSQSSPISFSLNYSGKRTPQFQNSNYFPQNTTSNNTNGPDCNNVVVPRRPSPLQAHSQPSPIGHAPSPAYPMYNSPMNSISSPQQTSNQVTPPSPLDVSVPRPTSQPTNVVAYPSVITRTEKTFPQNNQNCWEERRKFPTGNQANNYNTLPEQRVGQQGYFEANSGHQMALQDLSSCRGDPMSIVKNLQQQQQSCQVAQVEVKQEVKPPVKRRKSNEKAPSEVPRIPPPAHSSGAQGQPQNGAYFDFDRWNLPPPSSKIFTSQTIHQQHQGLMVPHPHGHHPPPPLPYFAPFHLPPHPSEFPSTVELTPINNYSEQNTQPSSHFPQQQQEDQPKVVVPNIEEELNFLAQGGSTTKKPMKPSEKPGSGFMSSYLKFLQGERDSSPPPATRGNRKQSSWTRSKPQINNETKPESNGTTPTVIQPSQPPVVTRLSQGDPQDDPRYFPLPKERKRNSFESDSDGISSDDDFFGNNKKFSNYDRKDKPRKKTKSNTERKKVKKPKKEEEVIPRRESTKRAAKEKINLQHLIKVDDDLEEPPEFQDSDSDPAWTPQAKEDGEEIIPISKKSRKSSAKKRRNLITAAAQGAGIHEIDGYVSDNSKKNKGSKNKQNAPPTLEDNIAASLSNNVVTNDDNPFKPGEFVVIRSELSQDWPAIWRVDGKTLLQKYEPFEQNGVTLYRNISTYTSWTPESKKQYISIPVAYKVQNHVETIVEFLRNEMTLIDQDYQQKCMRDCEGYQDNFEVYIQTLISQALDSNFLTEIFQEKDEYFLSNVKTIDDITDSKKRKLLSLLRWPPAVQAAVCTWPCFNVIREVNPSDIHTKSCAACGRLEVAVRVLMYGQPYNSTTLEGCQPDPKAMNEKNFLMCRICATRVELSNKVTHQKYLMYIECAKRVSEKRTSDPNKDTTCILNELLADENWLNQLFLEVRTSWAEIDCIEYSLKLKNSVYTQ